MVEKLFQNPQYIVGVGLEIELIYFGKIDNSGSK
jgi:hypothetical protein